MPPQPPVKERSWARILLLGLLALLVIWVVWMQKGLVIDEAATAQCKNSVSDHWCMQCCHENHALGAWSFGSCSCNQQTRKGY